jgi:DHA3 family macrolide efflux protein-like MFS transporter
MNRDFFLLLQGQFISRMGTQVAITATMFWLRQSTGSASLVGLLMAVCAAPTVLLGPLGGAFADRYSRLRILIYSDLICGAAALLLAGITYLLPLGAPVTLASILLVNILIASVHAFFLPAVMAAIPDILLPRQLAWGMSLAQSSGAVATIAGQALGGLLLPFGAPVLFLFDGLSYVFTAAAESRIVMAPRERPAATAVGWRMFRDDTVNGFRYVWSRPAVRQMFLSAIPLNVLVVPIFVLLPFYTTDVLHRSGVWFGSLTAAISAGSLIGYVFAGLGRVFGKHLFSAVCGCVLLTSVICGLIGWITIPGVAIGMLALLGFLMGWVSITTATILQQGTPEDARGRVFSLLLTLTQGLSPIAMFLAGIAADVTHNNIRLIYTFSGVGSLLVAVGLARSSNLRKFFDDARESASKEQTQKI